MLVMWAPEQRLFICGESRMSPFLPASHREVINYLSVNHQSALGATANHKLTLNLARKHTCANMRSAQTFMGAIHRHKDSDSASLTVCHFTSGLPHLTHELPSLAAKHSLGS